MGVMTAKVGDLCMSCHSSVSDEIERRDKNNAAIANAAKKLRIDKIKSNGTPQEKFNLAIEIRDFSDYSDEELDRILKQIKITTAHKFATHDIVREIDIISSESVQGMHIFKDLFASVRDIVGGRSNAVQDTLKQSKIEVMRELKIEAMCCGANGVIGVNFDYHQMSAGTTSGMMMLVATGTAVAVKEKDI